MRRERHVTQQQQGDLRGRTNSPRGGRRGGTGQIELTRAMRGAKREGEGTSMKTYGRVSKRRRTCDVVPIELGGETGGTGDGNAPPRKHSLRKRGEAAGTVAALGPFEHVPSSMFALSCRRRGGKRAQEKGGDKEREWPNNPSSAEGPITRQQARLDQLEIPSCSYPPIAAPQRREVVSLAPPSSQSCYSSETAELLSSLSSQGEVSKGMSAFRDKNNPLNRPAVDVGGVSREVLGQGDLGEDFRCSVDAFLRRCEEMNNVKQEEFVKKYNFDIKTQRPIRGKVRWTPLKRSE